MKISAQVVAMMVGLDTTENTVLGARSSVINKV